MEADTLGGVRRMVIRRPVHCLASWRARWLNSVARHDCGDSRGRYMLGPTSVVISAPGDNPIWGALGVDKTEPPDPDNGAEIGPLDPLDKIVAQLKKTRGATH